MAVPLIIVNFKTYMEATGMNAVKLAKACEAAAAMAKGNARIAVAAQAADIFRVGTAIDTMRVGVFAQHIDANGQGKSTGFVTAEAAREAGAAGTLLNHAEHKITDLAKRIATAKAANLAVVACAADVAEAKAIASIIPPPDYIAIEPPELIGGKVSVSKAKPEIVSDSVAAVKGVNGGIKVLCGAGINSGEDVKKAIELGTEGILVSSAVVLAKDPEKALMELILKI